MVTDWRRIDIDALESNGRLTAQDLVPEDVVAISYEDVSLINNQVKQLISKGEFYDGLAYVLNNVPYGSDARTKTLHASSVLEILKLVKSSSVGSIVAELSEDERDVLVKYLYKLMSCSQGQQLSGVILSWFNKTIEVDGGNGAIIRYLNDRRVV